MEPGFFNIPWVVWGSLALVVAGIYVVIIPASEKVNQQTGLTYFIVRWFHSLTWVLLAVSCFIRALPGDSPLSDPVAILGGISYVIYMVTFTSVRKRNAT